MEKKFVLEDLERILSYVTGDELTAYDKKKIVKEAVDNYNNYVNPGWLKYRK